MGALQLVTNVTHAVGAVVAGWTWYFWIYVWVWEAVLQWWGVVVLVSSVNCGIEVFLERHCLHWLLFPFV